MIHRRHSQIRTRARTHTYTLSVGVNAGVIFKKNQSSYARSFSLHCVCFQMCIYVRGRGKEKYGFRISCDMPSVLKLHHNSPTHARPTFDPLAQKRGNYGVNRKSSWACIAHVHSHVLLRAMVTIPTGLLLSAAYMSSAVNVCLVICVSFYMLLVPSCGELLGTVGYSRNTSGWIPNGIMGKDVYRIPKWQKAGLHSSPPFPFYFLTPPSTFHSVLVCLPPSFALPLSHIHLSPPLSHSFALFFFPFLPNVLGKQRHLYVCHGGWNIWSCRYCACVIMSYISLQKYI